MWRITKHLKPCFLGEGRIKLLTKYSSFVSSLSEWGLFICCVIMCHVYSILTCIAMKLFQLLEVSLKIFQIIYSSDATFWRPQTHLILLRLVQFSLYRSGFFLNFLCSGFRLQFFFSSKVWVLFRGIKSFRIICLGTHRDLQSYFSLKIFLLYFYHSLMIHAFDQETSTCKHLNWFHIFFIPKMSSENRRK